MPFQSSLAYADNRGFILPFVGGLYTFGALMTKPVTQIVDHIMRACLKRKECKEPIRKGGSIEDGSHKTHIFKALCSSALLVLAPVGVILRLAAMQFRGVFSYYHVDNQPLNQYSSLGKTPDNELTLLSYNIGAMPDFISYRNGLQAPFDRLELIAKEIEESGADVICLQEAFHADFSEALIKRLQGSYNYGICNVGMHSSGLSSGNALLSKYPIERAEYEKFKDVGGDDVWAAKGPLEVTIKKGKKKYNILTTHFNGGAPNYTGAEYRMKQLDQTLEFAQNYHKGAPYPTFFVADTNLPLTRHTHKFNTLASKVNLFNSETMYRSGTEINMNTGAVKPACPDLVGLIKDLPAPKYTSTCATVDKYEASDHLAVKAHVCFFEAVKHQRLPIPFIRSRL